MNYRTIVILPTLTGAVLACSSQGSVDIGENVGAKLSDYAANWDGYAEAYQFDDGSDHVRLILDADGQGTLQVGDRALYPPPTDPSVGYPPNVPSIPSANGFPYFFAGFQYQVYQTRVESSRIRLGVDSFDLLRGWCQIQTPIAYNANAQRSLPPFPTHACVPDSVVDTASSGTETCSLTDPNTQKSVGVDCAKWRLCAVSFCDNNPGSPCPPEPAVCPCTATGCVITPTVGEFPGQLDGALDSAAKTLVGTLLLNTDRVTIRMTRP